MIDKNTLSEGAGVVTAGRRWSKNNERSRQVSASFFLVAAGFLSSYLLHKLALCGGTCY